MKPDDFSIEYRWIEGSVPPPHHSEFTIRIGPGSRGEILYLPDYPMYDPPVRRDEFEVTDELLSELYSLMEEKRIFSGEWPELEKHPVGGSHEYLVVTADGKRYTIPAFLDPDRTETIREIYRTIRAGVPESIWSDQKAFQENFERKHHETNGLFDFLLTLGDHKAFDPEALSSLTGIPLTDVTVPELGNFNKHESPGDCTKYHPHIKRIEIKIPSSKKKWIGQIRIELNNTLGITNREIFARFGEVSDLSIPYPEAPKSDPMYLVYQFEWGELKFGIARDGSDRLDSVLLDAYRGESREKPGAADRGEIPYPLPEDFYITSLPISNQVNFETQLSLPELVDFYRQEFFGQGLSELEEKTLVETDVVNLAFGGKTDGEVIVLQAIDLHQNSIRDVRHVNIRTETIK